MSSKNGNQLEKLLEFLEENIDIQHIRQTEKLNLDAIMYREVSRLPLSIRLQDTGDFIPYSYEEAYYDSEKMLFNELLFSHGSVYNSVRLKDDFLLHVRSNHGCGLMPSLFGAKCKIINDNMPWVDHFDSLEEIKSIIKNGVPDFTAGLGSKVLDTHQYYLERLKEYPKCYNSIHITQPDMQGPFDIAHLLIGTDIFLYVYDESEMLHELLELITQTYIGFRNHIQKYLTDDTGENAVFVHGGICGGKVLIKDDTAAVNLSESQYNEFSKQYNDKILEAFGGGSIHHCGPERSWHWNSFKSKYLRGMNFGQPEMHDLKNKYRLMSEDNVAFLIWGMGQGYDFLREIDQLNIKTGMTLTCVAETYSQAELWMKNYLSG